MSDKRAEYLASASGPRPADEDHLDLIRDILGQEATWSEPPPEVADRLLAAVGAKTSPEVVPTSPRRRWPLVAAATLGAAALIIAIAGLMGVFSSPDPQLVTIAGTELEPAANGEASIMATDAGWWIRLELADLPAASDGTYYEGWVWNDDGQGVSIGTFHLRGGDEAVVLWSGVDPADYPSIWVTLEDEDGDPSASDRVVMMGRP